MAPTLLDLLARKEIVFNGTKSTEPILTRVIAFLGMEHSIGHDKSPACFATTLMLTCTKYFKLATKNPYLFRWMVLRPRWSLSAFERIFDLHKALILSLDLSFCHAYVTDTTIQTLANGCPLLTHCVVWGCHQLSDIGLKGLVSSCRYLTFLNFGGCVKITNASLECIGNELLYLDNLHMSGCPLLNDEGIASLLPASCVVLRVHPCDEPRIPLEFDLHHMKTQLRKFGCSSVNFRVMRDNKHELVLHFKSRPKVVGLWCESTPNKFMPRLTSADNSFHFAGQYVCTSLKVLNIVQCPRISPSAAVTTLKGHHIQLKVLS
ncbi:hypothetical protein LEN26_017136 [Aphanomyces euteiches]|nr:hypothetical protein LEN26_017136 [Aphanomyces euteiches]